jgi:hypothetical protein
MKFLKREYIHRNIERRMTNRLYKGVFDIREEHEMKTRNQEAPTRISSKRKRVVNEALKPEIMPLNSFEERKYQIRQILVGRHLSELFIFGLSELIFDRTTLGESI